MSERLAARVAMGKQVREVFDLYDGWTDEHWQRLRDELLSRYPLPAAPNREPMSDNEARHYETTQTMEFGKYSGRQIRTIPVTYLRWLCGQQEEFYGDLRRYLKSDRILLEERVYEEEVKDD